MTATRRWQFLSLLLAVVCVALLYRVFDQGVSRTYADASQRAFVTHIKLLTNLVEHEWRGSTEEQVMSRLSAYVASQPDGSIILKRNAELHSVYLEGVRFEFVDGGLARVTAE